MICRTILWSSHARTGTKQGNSDKSTNNPMSSFGWIELKFGAVSYLLSCKGTINRTPQNYAWHSRISAGESISSLSSSTRDVTMGWKIFRNSILRGHSTTMSQHPRTDLKKRFLPRPNTTIAWKLIPHRSNISKIWNPPHWELFF